jgi:hypothetical protein
MPKILTDGLGVTPVAELTRKSLGAYVLLAGYIDSPGADAWDLHLSDGAASVKVCGHEADGYVFGGAFHDGTPVYVRGRVHLGADDQCFIRADDVREALTA